METVRMKMIGLRHRSRNPMENDVCGVFVTGNAANRYQRDRSADGFALEVGVACAK